MADGGVHAAISPPIALMESQAARRQVLQLPAMINRQ